MPRAALVAGVVVVGALAIGAVSSRRDGPGLPELSVVRAVVSEGDEAAAAYVTFANEGSADRLLAVDSSAASAVSLHSTERRDGIDVMVVEQAVGIAPQGTTSLAPGGTHVMLEALDRPLVPGDEIDLTFAFSRSAPITVRASVVSYRQIAESIGEPSP